MTIESEIRAYLGVAGERPRYRSWEHCYGYFQRATPGGLTADRDQAALQLGFYLASWGMYRGSSFLLQHAYTVHLGAVDVLAEERFRDLWACDFGARTADAVLSPLVCELVRGIRDAYRPFAPAAGSTQPTDTLISKVILGTLGCLPACDRYFIDGFRTADQRFSSLNLAFIERMFCFCQESLPALTAEQSRIARDGGVFYPLMKLADMYFWQLGFDREVETSSHSSTQRAAD